MARRIPYEYIKYNGCPEATEISQSRNARKAVSLSSGSMLFIILILVLIFADQPALRWAALVILLLIIWRLIYLLTRYDKVTSKLVREAVERRNNNWKKAIESNETLVQLKIESDVPVKDSFSRRYMLHQKWLSGKDDGEQLALFAEDLSNLSLSGMKLDSMVFSHCMFKKMDLAKTEFSNCDLSYSIFYKCKTKETDFSGSVMKGVRFK